MWSHRLSLWVVFFIGILAFPAISYSESLSKAATLSITCAGCHGTDGKSSGAIPSIAGKNAEYIEKAMIEFRDGKRPSTVMQRHAKGYTDEEIKLMASYFAAAKK